MSVFILFIYVKMIFRWIRYVQNDIFAITLNKFVSRINLMNEFLAPNNDGNTVKDVPITKINFDSDKYKECYIWVHYYPCWRDLGKIIITNIIIIPKH